MERMAGSSQSLLSQSRTRSRWQSSAAAMLPRIAQAPLPARRAYKIGRRPVHRCDDALIYQEFAYRFHMAMQETCVSKRQAMLQQLNMEREAALRRAHENSRAETARDRQQDRSEGAAHRPGPRRPDRSAPRPAAHRPVQ
jgi:hypothetical protein